MIQVRDGRPSSPSRRRVNLDLLGQRHSDIAETVAEVREQTCVRLKRAQHPRIFASIGALRSLGSRKCRPPPESEFLAMLRILSKLAVLRQIIRLFERR